MKTARTMARVGGSLAALALWAAAADKAETPATEALRRGPRVLLLGPKDKTPTDFLTRNGPAGIVRQIDRFRSKLPPDHKARIAIGQFFNMNWGKYDDVVRSMTALDANGKPDGLEHHYDTQLEGGRAARTVTYQHGLRHGPETFYGQLAKGKAYVKKIVPWARGKVEGTAKTFFPDGKLMSEAAYVGGELSGVSKSYNPKGFVVRSVPYKDGKREGTLTERWSTTKKLRKVIPYKAGKVHGRVRLFHENGKPKREVCAWEDKFHGIDKQWYEDGTLRKTTYWILDEEVTKERFDRDYRMPPTPTTKPAGGKKAAKPTRASPARRGDT
jgi:antitoxin component YwqK of YwqJK toxin-antitoxin module